MRFYVVMVRAFKHGKTRRTWRVASRALQAWTFYTKQRLHFKVKTVTLSCCDVYDCVIMLVSLFLLLSPQLAAQRRLLRRTFQAFKENRAEKRWKAWAEEQVRTW